MPVLAVFEPLRPKVVGYRCRRDEIELGRPRLALCARRNDGGMRRQAAAWNTQTLKKDGKSVD